MLRKQSKGKQKPWTLEQLKAGLESFYKEHQRYPTATEVDLYAFLPSARSVERRFGGLVELRKKLGLKSQTDFRSGQHSTNRANIINKRAHVMEKKVYEYLVDTFHKEFVHREHFFSDDKRIRTDFFIHDKDGGFCVDVFYPSNRRNLIGCLNSKINKYGAPNMSGLIEHPMIFLQMNDDLDQDILNAVIKNKKNKLGNRQQLFGWIKFEEYCGAREALKVEKGSGK